MAGVEITPEEIRDGSYLEKVKPISASMWVDENSVPSVVAYGTHDRVQPYLVSLRLKAALEENGVDFRYFELPTPVTACRMILQSRSNGWMRLLNISINTCRFDEVEHGRNKGSSLSARG